MRNEKSVWLSTRTSLLACLCLLGVAQTSFAQVSTGNSVDEYLRCMKEAKESLKQCLADLAADEAAKNARYAACVEQANNIERTARDACQSQYANQPQQLAGCMQTAAANGTQMRQGCDTQKANDEAAITAKKTGCENDQARRRRDCALKLPQKAQVSDAAGEKLGLISELGSEFVEYSEFTLEQLQEIAGGQGELLDPEFIGLE